jgi:hypothetical protein
MEPSKYRAAIEAYSILMEEAKERLSAIDTLLNGQTGLPTEAVYEFSFLELRMLCELIALGCLTVHGDVRATSKLRKRYEADKIIKELEGLHPEFYPRAVSPPKVELEMSETTILTSGFLRKRELVRLYAKCGTVLHRGSKETMFAPPHADLANVLAWQRKIAKLLKYHAIYENVQWALGETEAALSFLIGLEA